MALLTISKPTQQQIKHGVERVLGVFVVAFLTQWALTGYTLNKVSVHSAVAAGATAVWQLATAFGTKSL